MIVIIPAHNQSYQLFQVLNGYLKQTVMPTHIVVVADKCVDNTIESVENRKSEFKAAGTELIVIKTSDEVSGFGAGFTRDYGLSYARTISDGPFLFTDGDCIPSSMLVEEHSTALSMQKGAAVCCGLRYETGIQPPDESRPQIAPGVYDDLRNYADHMKGLVVGDYNRLCINPEVLNNSWICWSCNMSMNSKAIDSCITVNKMLTTSTADRVFCSVFDGQWGGEDGFVGLTVAITGGSVIMMSNRSSVCHLWHDRKHTENNHLALVDTMRLKLVDAVKRSWIEAPKVEVTLDSQPFSNDIPSIATKVSGFRATGIYEEIFNLFPQDSLFLSVMPITLSHVLDIKIDPSSRSMLVKDKAVEDYVIKCRDILEKTQVLVDPFGQVVLHSNSPKI